MKVAVGSDHVGFELKEAILHRLESNGIAYKDFGAFSQDSVDYPDIAVQVAQAVAGGEFDRGVLICGTGIGMSIAANKVPGIRAALCTSAYCAQMSREHNDANILVLGARVTDANTALEMLETWLTTDFTGEERHARRIAKVASIEERFDGGR